MPDNIPAIPMVSILMRYAYENKLPWDGSWETNVRVSVNEILFTDRIFLRVYFDKHINSYAMARKMYLLPLILIFVAVF